MTRPKNMDDWFESERLHFAAADGDLDAIRSLVAEGFDVNAKDADLKLTPLHYAAAGEHIEIVRFLLTAGADVNAIDESTAGDTPLGHVAQECTFEMAKILLDAGANPLIPGTMQLTPLHRAARRKRADGRKVYELLLAIARAKFHYPATQ
ncbi:MAG: ankyrin repeat domain-containing protein [Cyanobacteria bacterium P01_H01_bin.153]